MKLYHATKLDNKDNILRCGLQPTTDRYSNFNRYIKTEGVYGFTEIKDALGFAKDQCWNNGIAIFSFETSNSNLILDPEYDDPDYGIAYFYKIEKSVDAILEYEIKF